MNPQTPRQHPRSPIRLALTFAAYACCAVALPGAAVLGESWAFTDFVVLAFFAAVFGGMIASLFAETQHWKPLLIVGAIALSAIMVWFPGRYGPGQTLRPGPDLAGGTTLVYELSIPDTERDKQRVIERTIQVLRDRIDPNNLMNLVFRPQPPNRIEIEMALAPPAVKRLRDDFLRLRDELLASNLDPRVLDAALRKKPETEQEKEVRRLAGDNADLARLLIETAQAYNAREGARVPNDELQRRAFELEAKAAELEGKADDASKAALAAASKELEAVRAELIAAATAFHRADRAYQEAQARALESNLTEAKLEAALSQPLTPADESKPEGPTKRQAALESLAQAHPALAARLRELFTRRAEYERVQGPLDDYNDLIALLRGSGVLEFRIAPAPGAVPGEDRLRADLQKKGPTARAEGYRWMPLASLERFADRPERAKALREDPRSYLAQMGMVGARYGKDIYVLLHDDAANSITHKNEGWELSAAYPTVDSNGFGAVGFQLNPIGGKYMLALTRANYQKPMAITLDGKVISAPGIQAKDGIGSQGIITGGRGGFKEQELEFLVRTLNAGSLQAQLSPEPIAIQNVDARLGDDNIARGLRASLAAVALVTFFMAAYYFHAGLIANFAVLANILLVLGAMAMLQAQFTMAGIAGIVLTVGMAVDANVLVYERIREEQERGENVHAAVRLGFSKALVTIIDSNLTTLITCVVLGYMGSAEVKGFAITLGIGLVASMFTAVFCSRVWTETYLRLFKPQRLHFLPTVVPAIGRAFRPNIDWIGRRKTFFLASALICGVSLLLLAVRGVDMLDIEFRSGTQVTLNLRSGEAMEIGDFRDRLKKAADAAGLTELAPPAANVQSMGKNSAGVPTAFKISTLDADADRVGEAIRKGFADVLDVKLPLSFAGIGDPLKKPPAIADAPIYVVTSDNLPEVVNRPALTLDDSTRETVRNYVGGVAILLDQITPAATLDDLRDRVRSARLNPPHNQLGVRQATFLGLDTAPQTGPGPTRWTSAVMLVRDDVTNYLDDRSTFTSEGGLAGTEWALVRDALSRESSLGSVTNFTSSVSGTIQQQSLGAVFISLLAIVVYIWFRFGSLTYGVAATVALIHDVIVSLGFVALSAWFMESPLRIDQVMVGAVLTIIGYSLNDTIVIFDRIREIRGRLTVATIAILNQAINQTISRTILTSGTTFLAVITLLFFGGEGVKGFAYAMTVGVVVGTYSTVGIASAMLLLDSRHGAVASTEQAVEASKPLPTSV
jgi:SecD/SecF fusion protein